MPTTQEHRAERELKRLVELEQLAGERDLRVEVVAEEAGEPAVLIALAAVLDRARELESQGRRYGYKTETAMQLRLGVVGLAQRMPADLSATRLQELADELDLGK